jgi:hypothetical protein
MVHFTSWRRLKEFECGLELAHVDKHQDELPLVHGETHGYSDTPFGRASVQDTTILPKSLSKSLERRKAHAMSLAPISGIAV